MGRWHPQEEYGCVEGEIPADPLGDLQTTRNKLSVWLVENNEEDGEEDRSNITRVATALAATCDKPDRVHYILISGDVLTDLGISVEKSEGDTPDEEANKQWHYDLYDLSAQKLLKLAESLLGKVEPKAILKGKIKEHLVDGLGSGRLNRGRLNKRMLIKLGVESGTCPKCGEPIKF